MVEPSEPVRKRLADLGDAGQEWLESLEDRIADLERIWDCHVNETLPGGSAAFVASAVDREGRPAVVKLAIPAGGTGYSGYERELNVLTIVGPEAYVAVFDHSNKHRALLLERLGRPLAECGFDVERQIDTLAETIAAGWRQVRPDIALPTAIDQLDWLNEFINTESAQTTANVEYHTITTAQKFINKRRQAFNPSQAVLIHGDAHPTNVLSSSTTGFKLIDPEGLLSERAHDLAIPLRGWVNELQAENAPSLAASWCQRLADVAGVAADAIWEWAFIERLSTGLLLSRLAYPDAAGYIATANVLRDVRW